MIRDSRLRLVEKPEPSRGPHRICRRPFVVVSRQILIDSRYDSVEVLELGISG